MDFKQTRHKFKGMMTDMSPDYLNASEYYVDAHNIRLTYNENSKSYMVTNDSYEELDIDGLNLNNVIGSISAENYIIVFNGPHSDVSGNICIINTEDNSCKNESVDFTDSTHVDAVSYRKNDEQLFVYFVDGVHGLRRLVFDNTTDTETITIEETNIEITPYLDGSISVVSDFNSRGGYEGGTVQYFVSVIKDNSISAIVYQTPLYYPCYETRGLPPERTGGQTFVLTLRGFNTDKIRLFSVYKAEDNSTYVKYKDISLNDDNTVINDYNDNTWIATDITEVMVLNGTAFAAKTVELGDYNLFMGNLKTLNTNQHDVEIPELQPGLLGEYHDKHNNLLEFPYGFDVSRYVKTIPAKIPQSNEFYAYDNQLAHSSKDIKIFKRRETYLFGYQLQDKYGQWSDVVSIRNFSPQENPSLGYYEESTTVPITYTKVGTDNYYITIPQCVIPINDNIKSKYVAIRPMVVYPTESQRNVIAQGIISPTVYRYKERDVKYPSWFYIPETHSYEGSSVSIKHPYKDGYALENDIECYAKIDNTTVTASENTECFSLDTSILTLNSPDIQSVSDVSLNLNMLGLCVVKSYATQTSLIVENPSYQRTWNILRESGTIEYWINNIKQTDQKSDIGVNSKVLNFRDSGRIVDYGTRKDHNYQGLVKFRYQRLGGHGGPELSSGEIWSGNYYADQFNNEVSDGDGSGADIDGYYKYWREGIGYKYVKYDSYGFFSYKLYPWLRTGSIINDDSNNVDVVKNKIFSEIIFSSEIKYFNTGNSYSSNVNTAFNENNSIIIDSDYVYTVNPDVVLPVNENKSKIVITRRDGPRYINDSYQFKLEVTHLPLVGNSNADNKFTTKIFDGTNTLTNICYSSKDHYVLVPSKKLYSEDDSDSIEKDVRNNVLSVIDDSNTTSFAYIAELTRNSVDINDNNINTWCIAGDTVKLPSNSNSILLKWTEGDAYFQRCDLLKTVPYGDGTKENNIVEIWSCFLETHTNQAGRYDLARGLADNTMVTGDTFKINTNYNQENNLLQYKSFDSKELELSKLSNWITWSGRDTDMTIDKYGVFDGTQMLKMNSPVTSIINYNNHLISLNKDNISAIRYNENVQIPTNEGGAIRIASDSSVEGYNVINNYVGCQRIETVYDDAYGVYFGDDNTHSLWLYNGEFTPLAEKMLMKDWFKNNDWSTFGDKSHNDVYFINNTEALNFNEMSFSFTSKFNYENCKFVHSTKYGSYSAFGEDSLLLNKLFTGQFRSYDIKFLDNEQPYDFKIFNNIEFRADMFNGSDLQDAEKPFEYIKCNTEYNNGEESLNYNTTAPSNLQKRFRTWRINIPRADNEKRLADNWMYTELTNNNSNEHQLKLYDFITNYYY